MDRKPHNPMYRAALLTVFVGGLSVAPAAEVTGADVKKSLRAGVRAILDGQLPDGSWAHRSHPKGMTCLATLALLQAGENPDGPAISRALPLIRRCENTQTYTVGLKIMVLARVDSEKYKPEIEAAARWLMRAQNRSGLWDYGEGGRRFDHSNTQFALLGLHAASQVGVRVPREVWKKAQEALLRNQNSDGGWAYQAAGKSYGSMTAAGVCDLIILGHSVYQRQARTVKKWPPPDCGKYRLNKPLSAALDWLGRNFRAGTNPVRHSHYHYWLYAVERCGILTGQRFFGEHDWYRAGATILVRTQKDDGLWGGDLVDTCFSVLFLAKGHKSLLVQKLKWSEDDAWTPVRHELDHLVAEIGDQLGEPVTWQVVPFDAPMEEWLAAPVLYITGYTFPELDEVRRARLRAYVEQGGTILADACCGREAFREGFEAFAAATFPEVPLRPLGPAHAVYHLLHDVEPYDLRGIDLGCRTSVIYSPQDLSCLWELREVPDRSVAAYELGTNIMAYAIGRRPLRDRLDAVVLPDESERIAVVGPPARDALRLGQIVYEGDWRPFPLALPNLAVFLRDEVGLDVITQPRNVRLADSELYTCPVLVLAGHFDFELPEAERAALAAHLRRGGFLVADACCGTQPFDRSFRELIEQMLPDAKLERLPLDHSIIVGTPGFDVTSVRYSPDVQREKAGRGVPELWGVRIDGRLAVVYSPYSLSCGLSGPAFDGCWGLESDDARRVASNVVLYALTH